MQIDYAGGVMRVVAMLLSAVLAMGCATAADFAYLDQPVSKVYEVKADKARIFSVGRQWIAENFRSAKAVVEYEDQETGTLIGTGYIPYPCAGDSWECSTQRQVLKLLFTMRMDTKDGKFRLEFTNLKVSSQYGEVGQMRKSDVPMAERALLAFGDQISNRLSDQQKSADW